MSICLRLTAVAFLAVFLAITPAGAATIANGDFEAVQIGSPLISTNPADIPGWTHSGTVGDGLLWAIGYSDSGGSITGAGSGRQFVTLGGGFTGSGTGSWSTSITGLVPGNSYVLGFLMADESTFSLNQQIAVDFLSGSSTALQTFTATGASSANYWRNWQSKQETFVATLSTATVRFSATTQFDVGLDMVSASDATSVPEPGTVGLIAAGFLGGLLARRRYSHAL
jgi:Protein of unknown function (DUF642)/PEP-CTERM motif